MMVAAREQRSSSRRAQCGRVEPIEFQAVSRPGARCSGWRTGPPNALDAPKPQSSIITISTFGAPSGGRTGLIAGNDGLGVFGVVGGQADVAARRNREHRARRLRTINHDKTSGDRRQLRGYERRLLAEQATRQVQSPATDETPPPANSSDQGEDTTVMLRHDRPQQLSRSTRRSSCGSAWASSASSSGC